MLKLTKVVHLSSAHPDRDTRIFYKECMSLAQEDFDVHLILAGVEERTEKNVQVHSVPKTEGSRLKRMWKTVNLVYKKALELDAEIYHLHDPELLRIARKLHRKGKKVIYDAHEDAPRQILSKPYLKFSTIISRIVEKYENFITSKINGVVTATPYIKKRFDKINSNVVNVNNFPIISELFHTNSDGKIQKTNSICYVGGITKVRGILELIESIGYCDCQLILGGKFESKDLKEYVQESPNWKKVSYRGFINREEVKSVYQQSKIGMVTLHPIINYLDSLPVKMFEYMLAGIPLVCSNFPYWEKIVKEGKFGICADPLNPKAIGESIRYLLDNPDKAKAMGENGQRLVLEKYNWGIERTKLIEFYHNIT